MKNFIKKTAFLIFILTFCFCVKNQSVKDDSLISLNDAQKEYSSVFFLKQVEYFPGQALYVPLSLERVFFGCNREILYDKSDFQRCMRNIVLTNFEPKSFADLLFKIDSFKDELCKIRKIIMFKDSLVKGEINLCEIDP